MPLKHRIDVQGLHDMYMEMRAGIDDASYTATVVFLVGLVIISSFILYTKGRAFYGVPAVFLGWALLSIAMVEQSQKDGQPPPRLAREIDGFLFLVMLGAVPYAMLAKDNRFVLERRLVRTGVVKQCPDCAEIIRREARVCGHCGNRFEPPLPTSAQPDTRTPHPGS